MKTSHMKNKMDKILKKLQDRANKRGIYEDYGQKEYRAFKDEVNKSDLPFAEKAQLCADFTARVSSMTPEN